MIIYRIALQTGFLVLKASFYFLLNVYNTIHNFSVWLKTGSNPAYNNRFQSHTGKRNIQFTIIFIITVLKIRKYNH